MSNWWEIVPAAEQFDIPSRKAVAYYRHSAQDRQENSIPIQQEQVQQWAEQIGIKIIHEFADAGKSGLNAEGRPAFTEMMEEWVKKRNDFMYVLCLDVSSLGPLSGHRFVRPIQCGVQEARQAGDLRHDRHAEGGRPALPGVRAVRAVPGRPVQPGAFRQGVARRSARSCSRAIGRAGSRRTPRSGCCWTRSANRCTFWSRASTRPSTTSG